jgi:DNA-binding CsgD family transcriptional regulator
MRNATPSAGVFYFFGALRLVLAAVIAWVVWEAPAYHVPLPVGWPLVIFLTVYDLILLIAARLVSFARWGTLFSLFSLGLDVLITALILLEFAYPANTDAPVFLPLLAFEGWGYWDWVGGIFGLLSGECLLLVTWLYQRTIGHAAFSPALLIFWMASTLILGIIPSAVTVLQNKRLPTPALSGAEPSAPPAMGQQETAASAEPPADQEPPRVAIPLTQREREVYALLKQGNTLAEIAEECTIEYGTVKTHVKSIYKKYGVKSRQELP